MPRNTSKARRRGGAGLLAALGGLAFLGDRAAAEQNTGFTAASEIEGVDQIQRNADGSVTLITEDGRTATIPAEQVSIQDGAVLIANEAIANVEFSDGGNNAVLVGLGVAAVAGGIALAASDDDDDNDVPVDPIDPNTNDTFVVNAVNDGETIDGGGDTNGATATSADDIATGDTIDLSGLTEGVNVDLDSSNQGALNNAPESQTGALIQGENTVTLENIENVIGTDQDDTLFGNNEANVILGGAGDDNIHPFGGTDFVDGGEGVDTLNLSAATGVTVDLEAGVAGPNTFVNFENVLGSVNGDDQIFGDDGVNVLNGRDGDDLLNGRGGGDTLIGGAGQDVFAFSGDPFDGADVSAAGRQIIGNEDFIEDFEFGVDTLTVQVDSAPSSAAVLQAALDGDIYYNIHSSDFPAGEVRGQLTLVSDDRDENGVGDVTFTASLDGAQEVPPVATDAAGTGDITFSVAADGTVTYTTTVELTDFDIARLTVGHLHQAPVGQNGPVVEDILADARNDGEIEGGLIDFDRYQLDATDFGVTDDVAFAAVDANDPNATIPTGANVIVLLNSDNDADPSTPFLAGTAAGQIAALVDEPGAGFFVYFNSNLEVNRLVYSTDLSDPTADLKIVSRQTDLTGQDAIDALASFSAENFEFVNVVPTDDTFVVGAVVDGDEIIGGLDNNVDGSDDAGDIATGDTIDLSTLGAGVSVDLDASNQGALNPAPESQSGTLTQAGATVTLTDVENVIGTDFDDVLFGNNENNVILGGAGNDNIHPFGGVDFVDGGDGVDTLNLSAATGVTVDLETSSVGPNTFVNFENVLGSVNGDDTILGDAEVNNLNGRDGDDLLNGRGGADVLTGGTGADVFAFDEAGVNDGAQEDEITDFDFTNDRYQLDSGSFGVEGDVTFQSLDANAAGATVDPDANVIVLLNGDNDSDPSTVFNARSAATQIADLGGEGAGFFVYFNSALNINRLVFSEDLADADAALQIVSRQTDLTGQDAIDALANFSEDNFAFVNVDTAAAAPASTDVAFVSLTDGDETDLRTVNDAKDVMAEASNAPAGAHEHADVDAAPTPLPESSDGW